jgi:VIT1/CCC1 family predicted Fe2+/Mn2+ transporter
MRTDLEAAGAARTSKTASTRVLQELGINETFRARPIQAALASASSFAVGAGMPILVTAISPASALIPLVSLASLAFL